MICQLSRCPTQPLEGLGSLHDQSQSSNSPRSRNHSNTTRLRRRLPRRRTKRLLLSQLRLNHSESLPDPLLLPRQPSVPRSRRRRNMPQRHTFPHLDSSRSPTAWARPSRARPTVFRPPSGTPPPVSAKRWATPPVHLDGEMRLVRWED